MRRFTLSQSTALLLLVVMASSPGCMSKDAAPTQAAVKADKPLDNVLYESEVEAKEEEPPGTEGPVAAKAPPPPKPEEALGFKTLGLAGSGEGGGGRVHGLGLSSHGIARQQRHNNKLVIRDKLGAVVKAPAPAAKPKKKGKMERQRADFDGDKDANVADDGVQTALVDASRGMPDTGEEADETAADLPAVEGEARPATLWPRVGYFENTYLGGNAAYRERLRRLEKDLGQGNQAWLDAQATAADVDAPEQAGMALHATLDRRSIDGPGRVWLQIGLRGSRRYGWRRPPLDVSVVISKAARFVGPTRERTDEVLTALLRRLGPQDRVELRVAGTREPVQRAIGASELRHRIPTILDRLDSLGPCDDGALPESLAASGESLARLSNDPHRVPGTRLVLVLAGGAAAGSEVVRAAHRLQLTGAVVSVVGVAEGQGWWRVANAGHGNLHRVADGGGAAAVDAELATLSRVVARLLRLNIRLGRHANAVRILGSRLLGQREVKRVKAREEKMDRALSKSMGLTADRGDDDDGLQTVIPYFYGDDSHVLLVELWVERPGAVADITLKYKDLVNLDNATARVSVSLGSTPRRPTPGQQAVQRNVRSTQLALSLDKAWQTSQRAGNVAALPVLEQAEASASNATDKKMVRRLKQLVTDNRVAPAAKQQAVRDALRMARDRKVGYAGK